jgi:hypothetical protein
VTSQYESRFFSIFDLWLIVRAEEAKPRRMRLALYLDHGRLSP